MTDTNYESLKETGRCALSALRDMVAALNCDYERLEELKDDRDDWTAPISDPSQSGGGKLPDTWAEAYPDDAAELKELEEAAGDCTDREDAEQRIQEDPLSLQFRSGWVSNKEDMEPEEFELLLTTGGPAVRIIGEIRDGQAHHPVLQSQDWGTPWTDYWEEGISDTLEAYCAVFCFEF